jgi:hypothetical protein
MFLSGYVKPHVCVEKCICSVFAEYLTFIFPKLLNRDRFCVIPVNLT